MWALGGRWMHERGGKRLVVLSYSRCIPSSPGAPRTLHHLVLDKLLDGHLVYGREMGRPSGGLRAWLRGGTPGLVVGEAQPAGFLAFVCRVRRKQSGGGPKLRLFTRRRAR